MKIATKLISSFIIVSILAGALGVFGLRNMQSVDKDYTHLYENYGVSLGDLGSAGIDFNSIRVRLTNILLTDDIEEKKALNNEIQQIEKVMESNLDKFGNSIQTENTYEAYMSLRNNLEQYNKARDEVINLSLSGQNEQAIAMLITEGDQYARDTENAIQDMFDLRKKNGAEISRQLTVQTERTGIIMVIVIALIMIVYIGFGIFISRMISKPVRKLVDSADKIADGDLNVVFKMQLSRLLQVRSKCPQ
ncbi:MCP four helix bundle domain-containing protein [Paenibacillus lentus]|uniref:MCP four helix bundle domain-containing protein n=1 Tax=Paenibacillus lentus TaxID=1338368 RepID=UPI001B885AB6|nr:MCP four helix bundle domain-containing protein [Paenibacillus lentus]